jgi:hypothetical protein
MLPKSREASGNRLYVMGSRLALLPPRRSRRRPQADALRRAKVPRRDPHVATIVIRKQALIFVGPGELESPLVPWHSSTLLPLPSRSSVRLTRGVSQSAKAKSRRRDISGKIVQKPPIPPATRTDTAAASSQSVTVQLPHPLIWPPVHATNAGEGLSYSPSWGAESAIHPSAVTVTLNVRRRRGWSHTSTSPTFERGALKCSHKRCGYPTTAECPPLTRPPRTRIGNTRLARRDQRRAKWPTRTNPGFDP